MLFGIDFAKFISPSFWLETHPGGLSTTFDIIFIMILVVGYGWYIAAQYLRSRLLAAGNKLYANFWKRFAKMALGMSIAFTFIFFFRHEGIPFLGGRYWFLFWAILLIIWKVKLLREYYVVLPSEAERLREQREKNKYL